VATFARREDSRAAVRLKNAIFAAICSVALFAPVWTRAAVLCFRIALVLWVMKLLWLRPKLPLLAVVKPMLAYLLLVFASTLFSPLPILSWGRMRTVELFLLALVVASNLASRRQVKALVSALTFSTLLAVGYTGWLYLHGTGVRLAHAPTPALFATGMRAHDVYQIVDANPMHRPEDWKRALASGSSPMVNLRLLRGEPPQPITIAVPRPVLINEGLLQPGAMVKARPERGQGLFYSYIPFSECLMLICVLTCGLCVTFAQVRHLRIAAMWGVIFLLFFAALISAETRATVAAVLVLATAMVWLVSGWRLRIVSAVILILLFVAGSAWFRSERAGIGWLGRRDAGTEYRLMMWRDGMRLAMEHPLLGIGMDTVEKRGRELQIAAYEKYPNLKSHFHSTYIQIAAECGVLALAAWVWLLGAILMALWKSWKQNPAGLPFERGVALGLLAAVAGFIAISVVHYTLGDAELMVVFWVMVGLGMYSEIGSRKYTHSESTLTDQSADHNVIVSH